MENQNSNRTYVLNKETSKIELHFSKEDYQSLSDEQKKQIKSAYLYSGTAKAWVSRSTNNHYSAIRIAEQLGFTDGGSIGERLSFEESLNKQVAKAEARTERYEQYSDNASKRAEQLQNGAREHEGDISFWTQPFYNTSGGRTFKNYRERIMNNYGKGFDEYRKSEYFSNKARTAEETASMSKFKDRTYLSNRIKESNKTIKTLEKNVVYYEDILYKKQNNIEQDSDFYNNKTMEQIGEYIQETLEKMEYEIDKLAYLENCLDAIGGIAYSNSNVKEGHLVKIRRDWELVVKANKTTVEVKSRYGSIIKYSYAEIQDLQIPEGYQEPTNEIENPYKVNDILVSQSFSGNRIIRAYQVLKVTAKGVQIQQINIDDNNKPIQDGFTLDKPMRKGITKSKYSDFIGCYDGDWQLYKWNDKEVKTA